MAKQCKEGKLTNIAEENFQLASSARVFQNIRGWHSSRENQMLAVFRNQQRCSKMLIP